MEWKLFLGSIISIMMSILFYKLLKNIQKSEEEDGGPAIQVIIGMWGCIVGFAITSIIVFLQALIEP